jgi:hypothetical protein
MKDSSENHRPNPIIFNDYDYGDEYVEDNKEQKIYNSTLIINETNTLTNETKIINFLIEQNKKIDLVISHLKITTHEKLENFLLYKTLSESHQIFE